MHTNPLEESETHRIILLRGRDPQVLLGSEGTQYSLPEVTIPRWQRVAENLATALCKTCGVDAISLSSLETSPRKSHSEQVCYEIMEPCVPQHEAPHDKKWVAVGCLEQTGFRYPCDFQAIRRAIVQSMECAQDTARGPFGRLGWFPDLQQWVQEEIATEGLHLNGRFRQLNASSTFSLIRFETDGPAVWFKAVGAPNQREYPVTLAMARLFSRSIPQIIATRPEWNGWLALEAQGPILYESSVPASWESAATELAELQIHSLGRSLHLLDPGARDLRAQALADFVEPFFGVMGELMERQTKSLPAPLSREELRCLSAKVLGALAVLEETGIPNTLGNLDINPGNIVCSSPGCVFLDWAEAFVGHPFLTFQYLLEHFKRTFGQHDSQVTQLTARYSCPWRACASQNDICRALEVVPLVAVFAYATGNDQWKDPGELQEPHAAGYLRGLTRRMERQARAPVEQSVSCLS